MTQAITYQCPSCSGVVYYDVTIGSARCSHCGRTFEEGEVAKPLPIEQSPTMAPISAHAKTAEDFLGMTGWTSDSTVAAHVPIQSNLKMYSCPSCGAQVVADQSIVSTDCPYCGNNMLVSGITTLDSIPTTIMPFELTREQAIDYMREHFNSYKESTFLTKDFEAQLQHVKGVYVPYYLFDASAQGSLAYVGGKEPVEKNEYRRYCPIVYKGCARFEAIPVDASSKMPDGYMDAIGPFDFRKLCPFSTEYVPGYLMEVPDETADKCADRARMQAEGSIERDLVRAAVQDCGWFHVETVGHEQSAQVKAYSICAVPVWLLHCTWKGKDLLIAVNGTTGKCVGTLPVDDEHCRKIQKQYGLIAGGIVALATILFQPAGIILSIALGIFSAACVGHIYTHSLDTAVESRYASGKYSAEGLVISDQWFGDERNTLSGAFSRAKEACWNMGLPIEQGKQWSLSSIIAENYNSQMEEIYEQAAEEIGGATWRGRQTGATQTDGQLDWLAHRGEVKQLAPESPAVTSRAVREAIDVEVTQLQETGQEPLETQLSKSAPESPAVTSRAVRGAIDAEATQLQETGQESLEVQLSKSAPASVRRPSTQTEWSDIIGNVGHVSVIMGFVVAFAADSMNHLQEVGCICMLLFMGGSVLMLSSTALGRTIACFGNKE